MYHKKMIKNASRLLDHERFKRFRTITEAKRYKIDRYKKMPKMAAAFLNDFNIDINRRDTAKKWGD